MRFGCLIGSLVIALVGCPSDDGEASDTCADPDGGESSPSFAARPLLGAMPSAPCSDDDEHSNPDAGVDDDSQGMDDAGQSAGSGGKSGGSAGKSSSDGGKSNDAGSVDEDEPAASDFLAALDAFNDVICGCTGADLDQCTGSTGAERECRADATIANGSAASQWLSCAASYLAEQVGCLQAADCDDSAIAKCDVVANTDAGDPLTAACGDGPRALDTAVAACAADSRQPEPTEMPASGDLAGTWTGQINGTSGSSELTVVITAAGNFSFPYRDQSDQLHMVELVSVGQQQQWVPAGGGVITLTVSEIQSLTNGLEVRWNATVESNSDGNVYMDNFEVTLHLELQAGALAVTRTMNAVNYINGSYTSDSTDSDSGTLHRQ